MRLIRRTTTIVFAASLSMLLTGTLSRATAQNREYPTVSYCDLMRSPERYRGKVVRVSAIYRYGFEWSELYCLECVSEARTWVDLDESFVSSTKAKLRKKIGPHGAKGRTVGVTLVGRFDVGGGYGHMGAYRFRLMVDRLEDAKVILDDSPSPSALPKEVLSRIHCP
jgi:hypothetical protein